MLRLLAILCAATVAIGDWQQAPKPEHYRITARYRGKVAPVLIETAGARRYRTVLRHGAAEGPNFAGNYTVVTWGCGLDSFEMAVVDARTGKVYFPPFGCITLAGGYDLPFRGQKPLPNPAYRIDSKLLVVVGVEDNEHSEWTQREARFYVFEDGEFSHIYSIAAPRSAH